MHILPDQAGTMPDFYSGRYKCLRETFLSVPLQIGLTVIQVTASDGKEARVRQLPR